MVRANWVTSFIRNVSCVVGILKFENKKTSENGDKWINKDRIKRKLLLFSDFVFSLADYCKRGCKLSRGKATKFWDSSNRSELLVLSAKAKGAVAAVTREKSLKKKEEKNRGQKFILFWFFFSFKYPTVTSRRRCRFETKTGRPVWSTNGRRIRPFEAKEELWRDPINYTRERTARRHDNPPKRGRDNDQSWPSFQENKHAHTNTHTHTYTHIFETDFAWPNVETFRFPRKTFKRVEKKERKKRRLSSLYRRTSDALEYVCE